MIEAQIRVELDLVRERLIALDKERAQLIARRDKLAMRLYEPRTGPRVRTHGEYIKCEDMRSYIEEWIEEWKMITGTGGQKQLAIGAGVATKTIRNILNGTCNFVSFGVADDLMTYMGRQDRLDELTIYTGADVHYKATPPDPPPSKYYED